MIEIVSKIGKIEVDYGVILCKILDVESYIKKVRERVEKKKVK